MKNCIYRQLGMSRILDFDEKTAKHHRGEFFVPPPVCLDLDRRVKGINQKSVLQVSPVHKTHADDHHFSKRRPNSSSVNLGRVKIVSKHEK